MRWPLTDILVMAPKTFSMMMYAIPITGSVVKMRTLSRVHDAMVDTSLLILFTWTRIVSFDLYLNTPYIYHNVCWWLANNKFYFHDLNIEPVEA